MKRTESAKKRSAGIKWDESNLTENEKIKAELNTGRVPEPKTPYHGPLDEEHMDEDGLQPLTLDEHHAPQSNGSSSNGGNHSAMDVDPDHEPEMETTRSGFSSDSDHRVSRSGFSSDSEHRVSFTGGSDHDEGEMASPEHKKKFAQHRRAHYDMRAAMRKARQLLTKDEDVDGSPATGSPRVAAAAAPVAMEDAAVGEQSGEVGPPTAQL